MNRLIAQTLRRLADRLDPRRPQLPLYFWISSSGANYTTTSEGNVTWQKRI